MIELVKLSRANPNPAMVSSWRMFLVSAAALYLELFFIRWVGTEVRVFAYVQNLVLIVCFLGFGVGCLNSKRPLPVLSSLESVVLLVLIISALCAASGFGFAALFSNLLTLSPDAALWGLKSQSYSPSLFFALSILAIVMVALLLWIIASAMIPLGQWVGYCFDHSSSVVQAYSVNLAGSLLGTWLLLVLSWFCLSPVYWACLAFLLILVATPVSRRSWAVGAFLLLVAAFFLTVGESGGQKKGEGVYWSPYQKLTVTRMPDETGYQVMVNNVGYMTMADTSPGFLAEDQSFAAFLPDSVYDSPFRFVPPEPNVLIVGAGAGNDASAALRHGAVHVDAVEIDPTIYALGKKLHPDHPYDSDKVTVIINDARNFMRRSQSRYDMIVFGLLDSHTEYSGYSNLRVDNYVYTKDAFAQARHLLKPNGVLILKFEVRSPWLWIGQRFYRTLTEVFGREPLIYFAWGDKNIWPGTIYMESDGDDLWRRAAQPELKRFLADHPSRFVPSLADAPAPATDDWPYPYNRDHSIPKTYLTVSVIVLLISLFMVRGAFAYREKQTWLPFLLGAGFLLMETQLISRLTLYFGTTWIVSGIAISIVLCMLVLANIFVELHRNSIDRRPYYVILALSLIANYVFPWEQLPLSPQVTGLLLGGAYAISVFMAGVIFTVTFQKAKDKSKTLGANVIGAVAGGLLQNVSFIFGLKALLLVAMGCYLGSACFMEPTKKAR